MIGLITDGDERAYRRETEDLTLWHDNNNLSLDINKTKEIIVDFRKSKGIHTAISIGGPRGQQMTQGAIHITDTLTWSLNTENILKKAQQRLYFLRRFKKLPRDW